MPSQIHGLRNVCSFQRSQASNAEINVTTKVTGDTMDEEVVDQIPNGTILPLNDLLASSYKDPCAAAVPPFELTDVQKHESGVNEEFMIQKFSGLGPIPEGSFFGP